MNLDILLSNWRRTGCKSVVSISEDDITVVEGSLLRDNILGISDIKCFESYHCEDFGELEGLSIEVNERYLELEFSSNTDVKNRMIVSKDSDLVRLLKGPLNNSFGKKVRRILSDMSTLIDFSNLMRKHLDVMMFTKRFLGSNGTSFIFNINNRDKIKCFIEYLIEHFQMDTSLIDNSIIEEKCGLITNEEESRLIETALYFLYSLSKDDLDNMDILKSENKIDALFKENVIYI